MIKLVTLHLTSGRAFELGVDEDKIRDLESFLNDKQHKYELIDMDKFITEDAKDDKLKVKIRACEVTFITIKNVSNISVPPKKELVGGDGLPLNPTG